MPGPGSKPPADRSGSKRLSPRPGTAVPGPVHNGIDIALEIPVEPVGRAAGKIQARQKEAHLKRLIDQAALDKKGGDTADQDQQYDRRFGQAEKGRYVLKNGNIPNN